MNTADDERKELIISATKKFIRLYPTLGNSLKRARFFNQLVEDFHTKQLEADSDNASRIYCRRGCSKCCSLAVGVTEDEAISVKNYAFENRIPIDTERLARQREFGRDKWSLLEVEEKVCVFLDSKTNGCLVHSVRPNSCRNHLVLDTDEFCGPGGSPNLKSYAVLLSHVCTTAAFNCCNTGIFADFIY